MLVASSLPPLFLRYMYRQGWIYLIVSDCGVNITRDHERLDYQALTYEIAHPKATWVVARSLFPRNLRAHFWIWNKALLDLYQILPPEHLDDAPQVFEKLEIAIDEHFIHMFDDYSALNLNLINNQMRSSRHFQVFQSDTPANAQDFVSNVLHFKKDNLRECSSTHIDLVMLFTSLSLANLLKNDMTAKFNHNYK